MYNETQLVLEIQREELVVKNKKNILGCIQGIKVHEALLTETMDKISNCPVDDEKQMSRLEKKLETLDKKLSGLKYTLEVCEKTIEMS